MPLLHQQQSVPTQLAVDRGPSCGSLLGHSQECGDSRPGHGEQYHPQALALPIVWIQLASHGIWQSCQEHWVSQVLKHEEILEQATKLDREPAPCSAGV